MKEKKQAVNGYQPEVDQDGHCKCMKFRVSYTNIRTRENDQRKVFR